MTNADEEEVKYPKLRLLQGGKGPPITGDNWLKDLKKGAVFTCKPKGSGVLMLYIIAFKHTKSMILVDGLNNGPRIAVDPVEFCRLHSFFELIEEGGERHVGDNNDSGEVRPSGVADNEDAPRRQPEHDAT